MNYITSKIKAKCTFVEREKNCLQVIHKIENSDTSVTGGSNGHVSVLGPQEKHSINLHH